MRAEIYFLCVLTLSGEFLSADPALASLLGVREDELIGTPFLEFIALRYRSDLRRIFMEKIEGILEQSSYTLEFLKKDGTLLPVAISTRVVRQKENTIELAVSVRTLGKESFADPISGTAKTVPAQAASVVALLQHDGPLVGFDQSLSVVVWNKDAEQAFGHKADAAIGRKCWEVVAGVDMEGNPFCSSDCDLAARLLRGEPIPSDLVEICIGPQRRASTFTTLPATDAKHGPIFLHAFQPIAGVAPAPTQAGVTLLPVLTPRQRQILLLLEEGRSTQEIAGELFLSVSTVRNHIKELLRKVGAHSRLEAVAKAKQAGLI